MLKTRICLRGHDTFVTGRNASHGCIPCMKIVRAKWYVNNKEQCDLSRRKHDLKRKLLVNSFKDKPCVDCNVKYPPYVMDFDHLKDKQFDVGDTHYSDKELIIKEISKCELVCSNCHRIRTFNRHKKKALDKKVKIC